MKALNKAFYLRLLSALLACIVLAGGFFALFAISGKAVGAVTSPAGEMTDISSYFSSYKVQDTQRIDDGGYVGEVQYTVYYDKAKFGTVTDGYKTDNPVIIYAVNTKTERVGTDSNRTIIKSMLDRGFVVLVLDYLSNEKAVSPAIDFSTQSFRTTVKDGTLFTASCFPSGGKYYENFLVPSGCNIIYSDVFWEIDKHATDGTLEKIVENWNTDFKGKKANSLVKWATGSTTSTRKKTADYKGEAVTWYNASGKADSNGLYTRVKWTVAEKIEDCVNPDGTPLDLNMYIHTVYPTNPESAVPLVALANSSNYPTTMQTSADPRAQFNGFLFQGYANAVFDYLWYPMAQNASFGYYDGNLNGKTSEDYPTVTNDHMNYSIHLYNDKLLNTAAMRYLRYLSLSNGSTYNFDTENFGVIGNSKGGWFTFLGEAVLQSDLADASKYSTAAELEDAIDLRLASFTPKRYFEGHHGETRYQNGKTQKTTVNGATIDGGERQPWLTYNGEEILSGCQLVYASNGSQEEDFSEGHVPTFVALHIFDTYNAAYGSANLFANLCRRHDVPSMIFEVPLGHMLAYGEDMDYGVDTYLAFFDFANYHLKDAAVKVTYVTPLDGDGSISSTTSITIKFSGPVDEDNIKKVIVADSRANAVAGTWDCEFGKTEWTFTPNEALLGGEGYTVTVPASIKGDNGKEMGEKYVSHFITEGNGKIAATRLSENHIAFNVPTLNSDSSGYKLRFFVENDAANVANIYAVDSLNAETGELIGSVNLKGSGYYELDISEYISDKSGKKIYFFVSEAKSAGEFQRYLANFDKVLNGNKSGTYAEAVIENGSLKITVEKNEGKYVTGSGVKNTFYENNTSVLSNSTLINGGAKITDSDYGRRYIISFKVYDTVSRVIQVKLNSCSSASNKTIDYDHFVQNLYTKAGEWVEYELEYEIYEPDYGTIAYRAKTFNICASPTGDTEIPFYLDDLTVTEIVTEIELGYADIKIDRDGYSYKKGDTAAFSVINGTQSNSFRSLKDALNALSDGGTVKLTQNYTVTSADAVNLADKSGLASFTLDLNGYTLTTDSTSALTAKISNSSVTSLAITVRGGKILLKDKSLISFKDSAAVDGKSFAYTLKLESTELVLSPDAKLTELITDIKDSADAKLTLNVTLTDCKLNVSEENFSGSYLTIFPVQLGEDGLPMATPDFGVSYTVNGGSIALTKAKLVRLTTSPKSLVFVEGDEGYTRLTLPSSAKFSSPDMPDGFIYFPPLDITAKNAGGTTELSTFAAFKSEGGISVYAPIPTSIANNSEAYPFVVFGEDGTYIGAASNLYTTSGAVNKGKDYLSANVYDETAKSYGEGAKSAYISMRRDYEFVSGETFDNFAQIQNDLTIDLCGYTLSTGSRNLMSYEAKMWSGSGDAKIFPTAIIMKNGSVIANGSAVLYLTAWESNSAYSVAGKVSSFVYENIDFTVGSNPTGMVVFGEKADTAATSFNITYDNCRFDLSSAKTGFELFGANHALWSVSYTVNGGDVIANGDSAYVMTNVDSTANAKNSIVYGGTVYGGSLTLIYADAWNYDANASYTLTSGESSKFITNSLGEYVLCWHIYKSDCATACALCATARAASSVGNHSFDILKWDGESHWYECECGAISTEGKATHSGGTAKCNIKAICEVCDEEYGSFSEHSYFDTWITTDTDHNRKCRICGEFEGKKAHEYVWEKLDTPTDDGMNYQGTCVCGHTAYSESDPTIPGQTPPTDEPNNGGLPLPALIAIIAGGVAIVGGGVTALILILKKKKIK